MKSGGNESTVTEWEDYYSEIESSHASKAPFTNQYWDSRMVP